MWRKLWAFGLTFVRSQEVERGPAGGSQFSLQTVRGLRWKPGKEVEHGRISEEYGSRSQPEQLEICPRAALETHLGGEHGSSLTSWSQAAWSLNLDVPWADLWLEVPGHQHLDTPLQQVPQQICISSHFPFFPVPAPGSIPPPHGRQVPAATPTRASPVSSQPWPGSWLTCTTYWPSWARTPVPFCFLTHLPPKQLP